ncbi:TniQ family protein [Palleronia sp. LCG004]|uniref:TniQ family protein n=1 Tax=Palleronia sp. LCG004 TaxID=3079304 RepID=UPI00397971E1
MPQALALRAAPVPRETVHSFLGRMAAMNGIDTSSFARDFNLPFRSLLRVKEETTSVLGALAGISLERMEEMVSWTGRPSTQGRMTYRREGHAVRALRVPEIRGYPQCLREDMDGHDDRPEKWMALRGDWLLRDVRVCFRHRHPLVDLWTEMATVERYDVQRQMKKIAPAILAGELDRPEPPPSPRMTDGSKVDFATDRTTHGWQRFQSGLSQRYAASSVENSCEGSLPIPVIQIRWLPASRC